RAQQILRERGTPEQQAVCERLWAGAFHSAEELRHYYAVMGPIYACSYDPAAAELARARGTNSPEPLNRAFGPNGFLRRSALRRESPRIPASPLVMAGRHDWICPPEFSERSPGSSPAPICASSKTAATRSAAMSRRRWWTRSWDLSSIDASPE